jgi:tetratricopeptide (TPR) repeat protein
MNMMIGRQLSIWGRRCLLSVVLVGVTVPAEAQRKVAAPKLDPNKIVNQSLGFLKEREPAMSEVEYALYERMIPIVEADPGLALTLLETMLDDGQTESAAFEYVLGNVYFRLRRMADAEARFRSAVKQFPTFQRAWVSLGSVYYATERYREAAPCFARALALGDREASTFGLLGSSLRHGGNLFAAESAYKQAMTAEPQNPDWVNGLMEIYLATEQYAPAAALARELVWQAPDQARSWTLYATILVRLEQRLQAIGALQLAADLGVADREMEQYLGDLCAQQGLHAEAALAFQRAGTGPEDNLALSYARSLLAQGRLEAVAVVLRALPPAGRASQPAGWLEVEGRLAKEQGRGQEARELLEKALRLDPLDGHVLLTLGRLRREEQASAEAQQFLEYATRTSATAFSAHVELAQLHLETPDLAAALRHAQEALALRPSDEFQDFITRLKTLIAHENANASPRS